MEQQNVTKMMTKYDIKRKESDGPKQPSVVLLEKYGVPYLGFPAFKKTEGVKHLFTTRFGGVSQGIFSTMNLSFTRGDEKEAVYENYRRIAKVMECDMEDMVCSHQTHTANIRKVTAADRGKGLTCPQDFEDIDGLVTSEKGICLALFFADCVPVYFADPVKKVIGLAHSGWKGTVSRISREMVRLMVEDYGCMEKDIVVAIGPSICQECYEVSEDVATAFEEAFGGAKEDGILLPGKAQGKYQLGLWQAVERTLLESGILKENITVTDVCTCCNPEILFSHRASNGKRGNLGAFLRLI